jgi:hypothetical protein
MATARERGSRPIVVQTPEIELPTAEEPQYVNEDGYGVDAQTFALALQHAASDLSQGQHSSREGIEGSNVIGEQEIVMGEGALESEEPEQTQGIDVEAEPLLSLSER